MSTTLIVEICQIEAIQPHTNADSLELAIVKGWQTVVKKGTFSPGDMVIYVPINSVLPQEVSDRWGVTQYLDRQRVKCAKLRGEPSFGLVVDYADEYNGHHLPLYATAVLSAPEKPWPVDESRFEKPWFTATNFGTYSKYGDAIEMMQDYRAYGKEVTLHPLKAFNPKTGGMGEDITDWLEDPFTAQMPFLVEPHRLWKVGDDVAHVYGIKKWEPQQRGFRGPNAGRPSNEHPGFPRYTDIKNMRDYNTIFEVGEPVIATEKIHGMNSRIGWVRTDESPNPEVRCGDGEYMAGSHNVRRRAEGPIENGGVYWWPLTIPSVRRLLNKLTENGTNDLVDQVIIYGEIYGVGVQSLVYGHDQKDALGYRVFDIMVNHRYLDYDEMQMLCYTSGVPTVPLIYRGGYSLSGIKAASEGNTTVSDKVERDQELSGLSRGNEILVGSDQIREGVVVRPLNERHHPKIGRVVLKYVGDQYLFAKGVTDSVDE